MKENKEIEAVVSNVDNNETKTFEIKEEKIYKRKDLITTAIIAFLIGAILTSGGFAISKALKGGKRNIDYRQNGIQRNINQEDLNNRPNDNRGKINRRGIFPNNDQSNNNQNPPSTPNNGQQPNNSNAVPNIPNNNNGESSTNKS